MKIAAIKKFCASLPGVESEIKWQVDLVYMIGGKMFAVIFEGENKCYVTLKVDDARFLEYTDRKGFAPAPYLARAKWVQLNDLSKISDAETKELLERSYELIAAKLTKKVRAQLGIA